MIMKDILSSIKGGYTIAKSEDSVQAESIVLENIKKAGKVLSQKNHEKLDEALALISEIKEAAAPQEEDEMKAEDIAEIVKQAVEPLTTKLDKIEKQVNGEETEPTPEELTEEEKTAAVIQKALEPITKRLENIENAASIRKGLDPDEDFKPGQQPIKKSVFSNLNL
ncbi:hypothetical protein IIA_01932 [Bacillus cereus VD014]|uniref:Uncharacterized protein n=1 Tax=Bacillus cereus (strain VD014) TaxID=1053223 RepID=A0A9W5K9G0_BACC8|nr:hypothetical protein IIA_01932 [Bacillus cereus VD014]